MANTRNKSYQLFYQNVELGKVLPTEADFPSLWGTFQAKALGPGELCQHLQDYMNFCTAADALIQSGKEHEWEQFIQENEAPFLDLIETEDWHLVESDPMEGDHVTPILVPNFCQNNEIVWRWNFSTSE